MNYDATIDLDTTRKYPNNASCEEANVPSDTKAKAQPWRTAVLDRKIDLLTEERHLGIEGMQEPETCQTSHPQNSPSSNNSSSTNMRRIAPVRKRGKACNARFLPLACTNLCTMSAGPMHATCICPSTVDPAYGAMGNPTTPMASMAALRNCSSRSRGACSLP